MTASAATELAFAGPGALAARVRDREVTPRELVELYARRIEALDPRLNAFRTTFVERALAEADATATDGPLAGVPIAVKDDLDVAGQVATRGLRSYGPPARADAEPVRRLRAAGAIPIGITNVPELMIFPWTATEANGITRNPWNLDRTPGGSSGGSASAVAAAMVAAATGSDGAGSIRIPAACCGLVGMKPTRDRVPAGADGTHWLGMSVFGAFARTVADSALLLDVLTAEPGTFSKAAATLPPRLRIAVSRKVPAGVLTRVSADQRTAWERTVTVIQGLGHQVSERAPDYGLAEVVFAQLYVRGIYEDSLTVPDSSMLEAQTRQMAAAGRYLVPDRRRARVVDARDRATRRIIEFWNEIDVLITPGLTTTALSAEGGWGKPAPLAMDIGARFTPFTMLFNVTGQPAIAVPAGIGSDGLPLSVQLVGRHGEEATLYALAAELESAAPWAERRPPIAA